MNFVKIGLVIVAKAGYVVTDWVRHRKGLALLVERILVESTKILI